MLGLQLLPILGAFIWTWMRPSRQHEPGEGPLDGLDLLDVAVFVGCLSDVLVYGWVSDLPTGLIGESSSWQEIVMTLTLSTYSADAGYWLRSYLAVRSNKQKHWSPPSWDLALHHVAGAVGLLSLLYWHVGGSLIVRLLLDNTTGVLLVVQRAVHWHIGPLFTGRPPPAREDQLHVILWESVYWVLFLIARVVVYPVILFTAIMELCAIIVANSPSGQLLSSDSLSTKEGQLVIMLTMWTTFACLAHVLEFLDGWPTWRYQLLYLRDRVRLGWRFRNSAKTK